MAKIKISRSRNYTVKETAKFFDVSAQSVRRWLSDDLEGMKVGKKPMWRISGAKIESYMKKYNCDLSNITFVP